jgi:putative 3-hydroxymyristoyl/3-hydroxydecanoyl-(acyl carrier protein) dehydratase
VKPLYDRQTILQLIPQRPPIVEVDEFYGIEGACAVCGLTVRQDNLLADGDHLSEAGLLEHMAQSAAARAGYLAVSCGEKVRPGYIGAVNNASLMYLPRIGEHITTTVEVLETVMDIALIAVSSRVDNKLIGECRMKIFTEQK